MSRILAIDPGSTQSGWCVINAETREPLHFGKESNEVIRRHILTDAREFEADLAVIEMVASYGMPVGAEVFETCVWIGKFSEAVRHDWWPNTEPSLVYRKDIKVHHCHSSKAKDSNITQALVDRFAPGQTNHGKGTKVEPGFFYGFKADIWQAFALAVYAADTTVEVTP